MDSIDERRMNETREELTEHIQKAREQKKWLNFPLESLWFSPDELEAEINKGNYIYDPENYQLRDPELMLQEMDDRIDAYFEKLSWWKKLTSMFNKDMKKLFTHKAKLESRVNKWRKEVELFEVCNYGGCPTKRYCRENGCHSDQEVE